MICGNGEMKITLKRVIVPGGENQCEGCVFHNKEEKVCGDADNDNFPCTTDIIFDNKTYRWVMEGGEDER